MLILIQQTTDQHLLPTRQVKLYSSPPPQVLRGGVHCAPQANQVMTCRNCPLVSVATTHKANHGGARSVLQAPTCAQKSTLQYTGSASRRQRHLASRCNGRLEGIESKSKRGSSKTDGQTDHTSRNPTEQPQHANPWHPQQQKQQLHPQLPPSFKLSRRNHLNTLHHGRL